MRNKTLGRMVAVATAAVTLGGGLAVLPATAALAAITCDVYQRGNTFYYAGYYGGMTREPAASGYSDEAVEAQCLLRHYGYNPGTIDGVFGPNSKKAAKAFQQDMNSNFNARLTVDGRIGPRSWPYLRSQAQPVAPKA